MLALLFSLFLMVTSTFIHYEILVHLNEKMPHITWVSSRAKVLVGVLTAILSHASHILLYATAYYLRRDDFRVGTLSGQFQDMFASFFYFSAETYTSLGLG